MSGAGLPVLATSADYALAHEASVESTRRGHGSLQLLVTMGAIVTMNRTRVCAQVLGTLRARKGTRKWNTPIQNEFYHDALRETPNHLIV